MGMCQTMRDPSMRRISDYERRNMLPCALSPCDHARRNGKHVLNKGRRKDILFVNQDFQDAID